MPVGGAEPVRLLTGGFPGKVGYDAFHYWECELAVRVSVGAAACGDRGVLGKPQGRAERRKMQGRAERQKMAAGGSGRFHGGGFSVYDCAGE